MGGFGRQLKLIVGGRKQHSNNKEHGEDYSKSAFATKQGSNHNHKSTQKQLHEPLYDQPTITLSDDDASASATKWSTTSRAVVDNEKGVYPPALQSAVYEASDEVEAKKHVDGDQLQPVVSARSRSIISPTSNSSEIRKLAASKIISIASATSSSKRSKTASVNSKAQKGEGKVQEAISRSADSASVGLSAVIKSENLSNTAAKTSTHSRWEDFWFGMQTVLSCTNTFRVCADLGADLDPADTEDESTGTETVISENESTGTLSSDVGELSCASRSVAASTSAAAAFSSSSRVMSAEAASKTSRRRARANVSASKIAGAIASSGEPLTASFDMQRENRVPPQDGVEAEAGMTDCSQKNSITTITKISPSSGVVLLAEGGETSSIPSRTSRIISSNTTDDNTTTNSFKAPSDDEESRLSLERRRVSRAGVSGSYPFGEEDLQSVLPGSSGVLLAEGEETVSTLSRTRRFMTRSTTDDNSASKSVVVPSDDEDSCLSLERPQWSRAGVAGSYQFGEEDLQSVFPGHQDGQKRRPLATDDSSASKSVMVPSDDEESRLSLERPQWSLAGVAGSYPFEEEDLQSVLPGHQDRQKIDRIRGLNKKQNKATRNATGVDARAFIQMQRDLSMLRADLCDVMAEFGNQEHGNKSRQQEQERHHARHTVQQ
jgi:hypothetical protein